MPHFLPLRGLRPQPAYAARVAAPPYDVLTSAEARAQVVGNPYSFLHVSKAEIDLPPDTPVYDEAVYSKARENFSALITQGTLRRDTLPSFYVYRMRDSAGSQTGLMGLASVHDYETAHIKRHELTRPDKEDDRVRHMEALDAQTGPVLLAYQSQDAVDSLIEQATRATPALEVMTAWGVCHELWVVDNHERCAALTNAMQSLSSFYIADGHHRAAAAARVAAPRRSGQPDGASQYFLAVAFPHDQMRILDYNRVVLDMHGMREDALLRSLATDFELSPADSPVIPATRGEFGVYQAGRWQRLRIRPERVPADPVRALDVSVLSERVLGPLFDIQDLRRDKRIDFVGGSRGVQALMQWVDSGKAAVAFSLYPTAMEDLMIVADNGQIMPPKSTWFEPKLVDGLVCHLLEGN